MRATSATDLGPGDLRRAIERLEATPMRPSTARQVLSTFLDDESASPGEPSTLPLSTSTDPAWALELSRVAGRPFDPLDTLARHRWWPASASTGPVAEALGRLWRHSAAVAFAARRLAREVGDPDPEAVARAGLLHALGLWALAAVVPEALVAWYESPDPASRRDLERRWLGVDACSLGRLQAARWGCEPLVVDAAWLHADLNADLNGCSDQPDRLALIQQAYASAAMTPWAPGAEAAREFGPIDPRVRILTAEVQARCGGPFVEIDASPREERLTRDNARLRLDQARRMAEQASKDRFLAALAESSTNETPDDWAERAGLAWCGEPGIAAARVVWAGSAKVEDTPPDPRPASIVLPLGEPARPYAFVHLWRVDDRIVQKSSLGPTPPHPNPPPQGGREPKLSPPPLWGRVGWGVASPNREPWNDPGTSDDPTSFPRPAILTLWDRWAREVAERARLGRRLDDVVSAHRGRVDREAPTRHRMMLDALAEFAAGAGHELNNPLAVIVGRAQLLMARDNDPEATRSLRAIIAQAQRAARILRDLMYVARPGEPRPRPCQPEEIVRACLRDLQGEAEVRGVRIVAEAREPGLRVWADPEPLRQLADILTRNAMEATPVGGLVQFTAGGDVRNLRWTVHDNGRGIGAAEGSHLFDPFYCGRQAGRGLGLGLPRAARIVEQAGGELKWQSVPGHGTTFHVTLPVSEIPPLAEEERPGGPKSDRALPAR